jgi:general secretion pathway protein F
MPAYRYEALDAAGKSLTGLLEADNARSARAQLRQRELVPLTMAPVLTASTDGSATRFTRRVFSNTDRAVWTRQLAGLVGAGLPLERALTALAEESDNEAQRELVAHLKSEVNAGSSFGRALATAPREFDEVYRAVVAAGEQSGALGPVLERLADDLEQQQALRTKVLGAMLYPTIVSVVALVIVIVLVTWVVPQIATVFTTSKRALPFLTVAMLGISAFVRSWGWAVALLVAGAVVALSLARRNEAFRERSDAWVLRLPLLGRLARGYNAARFGGTLALLAGAGVPILKALQAAAETLGNRAMRADAMDALVQVREKRFPGLLAMFARLGEQTGQLPQMLNRASTQMAAEVQRRALSAATIMEPLLIVGMGLLVVLIMLAVLMPIIQLNTWVK